MTHTVDSSPLTKVKTAYNLFLTLAVVGQHDGYIICKIKKFKKNKIKNK